MTDKQKTPGEDRELRPNLLGQSEVNELELLKSVMLWLKQGARVTSAFGKPIVATLSEDEPPVQREDEDREPKKATGMARASLEAHLQDTYEIRIDFGGEAIALGRIRTPLPMSFDSDGRIFDVTRNVKTETALNTMGLTEQFVRDYNKWIESNKPHGDFDKWMDQNDHNRKV